MNYLVIDESKRKFSKYVERVKQLDAEVNSSLSTLRQTLSTLEKKDQTWQVLEEKGEGIGSEIVEELSRLERTHFSAESEKLKEIKTKLVEQYQKLLGALNEKKSFIAEQRKKKTVPIVPFYQEKPQVGYCYSCKVSLSDGFSYQLENELKEVLKIKIVEGAYFCSKDCLSKYCEKYEKWERAQQVQRRVHQDKIIRNQKLLTHLQEERTSLQERHNFLKKRELEAELTYRKEIEILRGKEKKPSAWRKFLYKLGLAKDNSPRSNLNRLSRLRQDCESEMEKNQAKIRQVFFNLTIDEKFDHEWEEAEKNSLRLSSKKEDENE